MLKRGFLLMMTVALVAGVLVPGPASAVAPDGCDATPPTPPSVQGVSDGYWLVDDIGNVYAFGSAQALGSPRQAICEAGSIAVKIASHPDGQGYWVLDNRGVVYAYGEASNLGDFSTAQPSLLPGEQASTMAPAPDGAGYWIFTNRGRALNFGSAEFFGDATTVTVGGVPLAEALVGPIIDAVALPDGSGYYQVGSDGGVFTFGSAEFFGSTGDIVLNQPVNGLVPDPDGEGYWLVADDGGVFSFAADFRGSLGDIALNAPVVGMVAYGNGYLMVATDGGMFSFSDRSFAGSLGATDVPAPIISAAALVPGTAGPVNPGPTTTQPPVTTPPASASCRVTGSDPVTGVEVELAVGSTTSGINDLLIEFDVIDGAGAVAGSWQSDVRLVDPGEQVRVRSESWVDPGAASVSTFDCEVTGVSEVPNTSPDRLPAASDSCRVSGVDAAGNIELSYDLTSRYDRTENLLAVFAVRDDDGVRVLSPERLLMSLGAGERVRDTFGTFNAVPTGLTLSQLDCNVLGTLRVALG